MLQNFVWLHDAGVFDRPFMRQIRENFARTNWANDQQIILYLGLWYSYVTSLSGTTPTDSSELWLVLTGLTYTLIRYLRYNVERNNNSAHNTEYILTPRTLMELWLNCTAALQKALGRHLSWFDLLYAANFRLLGDNPSASIDERFQILFTFSAEPAEEEKYVRRIIHCHGKPDGSEIIEAIRRFINHGSNNQFYRTPILYMKRGGTVTDGSSLVMDGILMRFPRGDVEQLVSGWADPTEMVAAVDEETKEWGD